jgi:hypothetical protein
MGLALADTARAMSVFSKNAFVPLNALGEVEGEGEEKIHQRREGETKGEEEIRQEGEGGDEIRQGSSRIPTSTSSHFGMRHPFKSKLEVYV